MSSTDKWGSGYGYRVVGGGIDREVNTGGDQSAGNRCGEGV